MHARTSSWKGSPDAIERWADHVKKNVRPMVEHLPGNAGAYFFVDRADGRDGGGTARSRPVGAGGVGLAAHGDPVEQGSAYVLARGAASRLPQSRGFLINRHYLENAVLIGERVTLRRL